MASSGVTVSDECIERFNDMRLKHKYSFLIMSVKGEKQVEVDEVGNQTTDEDNNEETFNKMKRKVVDGDEPKYIVFDFVFKTPDGKRQKLVFINWCSDNCNIKKKMLQSSSEDAMKKAVNGVHAKIQANDSEDLDYQAILKDIKRSGK